MISHREYVKEPKAHLTKKYSMQHGADEQSVLVEHQTSCSGLHYCAQSDALF